MSSHFKALFFSTTLFIILSDFSFTAQGQRLQSARHSGTVIEQMQKSAIFGGDNQSVVDELLSYAYSFQGTPYRHGAMSPRAFDCSGFTSYVFSHFGIKLDRSSRGQVNDGRRVSRSELKPGDLVFFNGRAINRRVGHVGIVTRVNDDDTFHFIHAARRGVTESKITESYYSRRYMGACRVIE